MLIPSPLWVFGYGSLLWYTDFDWVEKRRAVLRGWTLKLWQSSTDHRGTPEAPGRVATLVRDAAGECHGLAFRVEEHKVLDVLAYLDEREKGGYEREQVHLSLSPAGLLHFADAPEPASGIVYLAREDNACWVGHEPLPKTAGVVRHAVGPSGTNIEYVRKLGKALHDLGAPSAHVDEVISLADSPST